jgi:hypothetical protein
MAQTTAASASALANKVAVTSQTAGSPAPRLQKNPKTAHHTAAPIANVSSTATGAARTLHHLRSLPPSSATTAPAGATGRQLRDAPPLTDADTRGASLNDDEAVDPAPADDSTLEAGELGHDDEQGAADNMDTEDIAAQDAHHPFGPDWTTDTYLHDIHLPGEGHPYAETVSGLVITSGISPDYGHDVDVRGRHSTVQGVSGIHSTSFKSVANRPHQLVHSAVMLDGVYWAPGITVQSAEQTVKNELHRQGLIHLLPQLQGKEDHTAYIEVHPIQGTNEASSSLVLHCADPAAAHQLLSYQARLKLKVFPPYQPTYGPTENLKGVPVVSKWPGYVETPKQDRQHCRVVARCDAFVDQPRAVVHDVLSKLQRHISAKFREIPPADRLSLLSACCTPCSTSLTGRTRISGKTRHTSCC